MPDDTPRPIEELLRAAATARREEGPRAPEMPGPMRTRLQKEVARTSSPPLERATSAWFTGFWPRLALAAAVVIALGVAFFHDRPKNAMPVAMEKPELREAVVATQPQPESAATPLPAAPSLAAQPAVPEGEITSVPVPHEEAKRTEQFAAAPPIARGAFFSDEGKADVSAGLRQGFQQIPQKSADAPEIMQNFIVSRSGNDVRIVDADGSVYRGNVAETDGKKDLRKDKLKLSRVQDRADAALAGETFAFSASGVNRTLNQAVVIEGDYLPPAESPDEAPPAPSSAPARDAMARLREAPAQLMPEAARIRARAQISDGPAVTIDAFATETSEPR